SSGRHLLPRTRRPAVSRRVARVVIEPHRLHWRDGDGYPLVPEACGDPEPEVAQRRPQVVVIDRGGTPYRLHLPRSPIQHLRVEDVPRREHLRMGGVDGYVVVSRWLVGGLDIPAGLVDVDADEVDRGRDRPQFLVGE